MSSPKIYKLRLNQAPLFMRHVFANAKLYITPIPRSDKQRYYIPGSINSELLEEYKATLDWVEKYYQTFAKQDDFKHSSLMLLSYAHLVNIELEATKEQLLHGASKISSIEDKYFTTLVSSIEKLTGEKLSSTTLDLSSIIQQAIPTDREGVSIIEYAPLNEQSVLVNHLYEHTWQNQEEVEESLDDLSYKQKYELLKQIDNPNTWYVFESITEPANIFELKSKVATALSTQELSPYYGYDVIGEESAATMSQKCFDLSYKLYSQLQTTANPELAQLAVLYGHRQRYKFKLEYSELKLLTDSGSEFQKKLLRLADEKHPTLFEDFTSIDN